MPDGLNAAGLHLLEADHEDDVDGAVFDECAGELKACRSGRAGVVGVVDGYAGRVLVMSQPESRFAQTITCGSGTDSLGRRWRKETYLDMPNW